MDVGQGNPQYRYTLGDEGIESSPAEKDLGIMVGDKLDMSQQCALATQKALLSTRLHPKQPGQQVEDSVPLLHSGQIPPGVLHPALEASAQERHGPVGEGPEEDTKMIRGMEHLLSWC